MIEVRDLSLTLGGFSLRDINITLNEGRCLAIIGSSGAGKTLLLETVMGAHRPDSGQVLLQGRDVTALPPESRRIAIIPQDLALFPHLSVRDNIVFGVRRGRGGEGSSRDAALHEIARALAIEHLLPRRDVRTLSGGEQQRVALARALIVKPRVLFLDEPFCSLDAATRTDLLRAFRALRRERAMTVFLVTHDMEEAAFLADEIAIMKDGRILQHGPRDEVLQRPATVAAARFLNLRNIFGREVARRLCPADEASSLREDARGSYALHPESLRVLLPDALGAESGAPARLMEVMPLHRRVALELELSDGTRLEASLPRREAEALLGRVGQEVRLLALPGGLIPLQDDDSAG